MQASRRNIITDRGKGTAFQLNIDARGTWVQ